MLSQEQKEELIGQGFEYFSFSSLKSLITNEKMFYKNYVLYEREVDQYPAGIAGGSSHKAVEEYLNYKDSGHIMTVEEMIGFAWKCAVKDYIENAEKKDHIKRGKDGSPESIKEAITIGLSTWYRSVRPKLDAIEVISKEEKIIEEINGFPIKCYMDCIVNESSEKEPQYAIRDWKFKGKMDGSIEYKMQLAIYALSFEALTGNIVNKGRVFIMKTTESRTGLKQPDLKKLYEDNGMEYRQENGKYLTNEMAEKVLLEKGIIKKPDGYIEVVVDFEKEPYLKDMAKELIEIGCDRVYDLLINGKKFTPNIFDDWKGEATFDLWKTEYVQEEAKVEEAKKEVKAPSIEDAVF